MYLIDANVWLHRLLDHDHSQEVEEFLDVVPPAELLVTDFTLHSLGVILDRLDRRQVFLDLVRDVVIEGGVEVVSLAADRMERLVTCMDDEELDFDDAYQYVAAEDLAADLVSYDQDFDRTTRGRRTPAEIVAEIRPLSEESGPQAEEEPPDTGTDGATAAEGPGDEEPAEE